MAKDPGPIALRAAQEFEANVGVREDAGRNNRSKFIDLYNRVAGAVLGSPWCMSAITFRLVDAARDLGMIRPAWVPTTASTVVFASAAKAQGLWLSMDSVKKMTPEMRPRYVKRGDLIFFYKFVGGEGRWRIGHVEMVTNVGANGFNTVGGNTSGGTGSERDGQGVFKKYHSFASQHAKSGFARLPF